MSVPPPTLSRTEPQDAPSAMSATSLPLWTAPAAILLGLGLGQVGVVLVSLIGQSAGGSTLAHPSPAVSLISDVVADAGFVLAALYFLHTARRAGPADVGFVRTPLGRALATVAAAGVTYYVLTYLYAAVLSLHGKDKLPSELGVHPSTAALAGAAAFVCVVAPIAEEFFFRGFLFGVLARVRDGRPHGIRGSRRCSSACCSAQPISGRPRRNTYRHSRCLGFLLCLVRWRTGSLYPCMALHSLNNSLALGVNELHWNGAEIAGLIVAALAVIGILTAPLAARQPPCAIRPAP